MSVEFTQPAGAQYLDFGAPAGAVGLTAFTMSLWIRPHNVGSASSYCSLLEIWDGTGTDSDQDVAIYRPSPYGQRVNFSAHFSTSNGIWGTTTGHLTVADVWYHICVTYDGASTANDPVIYINGAAKAITQSSAPTGTLRTGTSVAVIVGDKYYSGWAPDGEMADVRIYSGVLTAAQVLALYNDGVFTPNFDTNLVFHAPLNNCTALSGSDFNGYTLTSSQILLDRIGCAQGTPSGSPLGSDENPT